MVKAPHSGERFGSVVKWNMLIFQSEHDRAKYKGIGKIPQALNPQTGVPNQSTLLRSIPVVKSGKLSTYQQEL